MSETLRRTELLAKLSVLKEKFPSNFPEITNNMSDDQLEIIYLTKFIELEDRSKFKDTLEKLSNVLGGMFPVTVNENKADLTVNHYHIIKFEK